MVPHDFSSFVPIQYYFACIASHISQEETSIRFLLWYIIFRRNAKINEKVTYCTLPFVHLSSKSMQLTLKDLTPNIGPPLTFFLSMQVYPDKDINNIVESNHYTKIGGWCKLGRTKCRGAARWVKPFRCLGKPIFQVMHEMRWRFIKPHSKDFSQTEECLRGQPNL